MTKYHINPETGRPGQCTASIKNCKYAVDGNTPEHYGTKEEARQAVEEILSKAYGITSSMKKNPTDKKRSTTAIKKPKPVVEEENDLGFTLNQDHSYKVPTILPAEGYMGSQGWIGEKLHQRQEESKANDESYHYMSNREVTKEIRNDIKEAVKKGYLPNNLKYSIRNDSAGWSSSINVKISGLGDDYDTHEYDNRYERIVPKKEVKELIERVENIHSAYNSDSSNSGVDYFNRGYYGQVSVLKDSDVAFEQTEKSKSKLNKIANEKIKSGMTVDEIYDDSEYDFAKNDYYESQRNYYEKNNINNARYNFTQEHKRMPNREEDQRIKGKAMNDSYEELDKLIQRYEVNNKRVKHSF